MNRKEKVLRSLNVNFKRSDQEERMIEGYFALYEAETELYEGVYEIISRGAFVETLNKDVRALWNHDTMKILGRSVNGTLELKEDEKGLFARFKLPNTSYADDLLELVKNGYVNQASFGFYIEDEELEELASGAVRWRINKINLFEVSVVTFPAYENTCVSARSAEVEEMKKRKIDTRKVELKKRMEELKCQH